jgi:O-acetyl-ADP-ribose deacetylase (regulator of RNase III)
MLEFKTGDMFASEAQALVNTVNCVGVMGKGVALEFKKRWPGYFADYKRKCDDGLIEVGSIDVYINNVLGCESPTHILSLPTKKHWRNPSEHEWVDDGVADLARVIDKYYIASVAMPLPGCGNGGLNAHKVKSILRERLYDNVAEITVYTKG